MFPYQVEREMEDNRSSSFRVYTPRELSIAPVALRSSAPPPSKGVTFSGMLFLVGVALAIGGSSWAAMRYVKSDFVATASAMETKAPVDAPPPPVVSAEPPPPAQPQTSAPPAQTSASAKTTARPKKGSRQARPATSSSAAKGERPPPNPYDDLSNIERAPTKP
jgi:hypothetical protein